MGLVDRVDELLVALFVELFGWGHPGPRWVTGEERASYRTYVRMSRPRADPAGPDPPLGAWVYSERRIVDAHAPPRLCVGFECNRAVRVRCGSPMDPRSTRSIQPRPARLDRKGD